jgi:uncharacterized membrane protein (DUF2068 family)
VRRGKEIRGEVILRIFAVERVLRFVFFALLAYLVWRFRASQHNLQRAFNRELPILRELFRSLGVNVHHSRLLGIVDHALRLSPRLLGWLAIGLAAFAVVELIEGIGLWLAQRWGEYFAAVVTSLGLPYELYDISNKFTWTRLILLMINLALVLYLLLTRRLFGVRGGKAAYEARLRSLSVIDEAVRVAEQHRAAHTAAGALAAASAGQSPGGLPAAGQSRGVPPAAARPVGGPPASVPTIVHPTVSQPRGDPAASAPTVVYPAVSQPGPGTAEPPTARRASATDPPPAR